MNHPAPAVACREAALEETPRSAKVLVRYAEATDWRHRVTYAKGTTFDAQGQPSRLVESVVVRLRRAPLAAVASWHDGKFAGAWVWSLFTNPRSVGSRDLNRFVKGA